MKYNPIIGLYTFCKKEISRFLNVYLQTLIAPMITTILFYFIFAFAVGKHLQISSTGIPIMIFIAPGLAMMAMMQNAFANTSSSIITSKVMGNMRDIITSPLSPNEIIIGYISGSIMRGCLVGILCLSGFYSFDPFPFHDVSTIITFTLLGTVFLSLIGIVSAVCGEKYDHLAAITNFIIVPATSLSGAFFTLDSLPITMQKILTYNPFFYIIDGFRSGFIGHAESNTDLGMFYIGGLIILLYITAYVMFKTGYKLKG